MAHIHLDALPPRTTKGTIVRLLIQVGELDKNRIGAIELHGPSATVEVPERWVSRLVKSLDGAQLGHRLIRARHADSPTKKDNEDHFSRLLRLLDIESQAQAQQLQQEQQGVEAADAERTGNSLVDLVLRDQYTGLGGRRLLTLTKRDRSARLPWTRLNAGSPVLVSSAEQPQTGIRGVVSRRDETEIEVAVSQAPEADSETFRLDHSSDEVAAQRQRSALQRAQGASGERLAVLRGILLGEQPAGFRELGAISPLDGGLNNEQMQAVALALAANDLAIVHGPPGTGKTTTLVELIRQAIGGGEKVLACGPSNLAVDNLFERLLAAGERVVRVGHPARVLPQLREFTLDLLVEKHPEIKLARKLMRDAFALLDRAGKFKRAKPPPGAKREMRDEAKQMLDDARRIEAQVVQQILDSADVLCATLTGIDSDLLGQRMFDLAVVDEACQTTEPACWIPFLRCQRIVLAGDHCQLPPTVVSREAAADGFAISLMERLMSSCGDQVAHRLSIQYRMHADIMRFSSAEFYDDSLVADVSVAEHLLAELPEVDAREDSSQPWSFIDTAGAGFDEEQELPGRSLFNSGEARVVLRKLDDLLAAGLAPAQVAVVTPYAAQVRHLRAECGREDVEIDTVDGFQGREKEAILISLVRSNGSGEIGFLADTRRMNVALTRARRCLVIVGDSATIAGTPFYARLISYSEQCGGYKSVWEED